MEFTISSNNKNLNCENDNGEMDSISFGLETRLLYRHKNQNENSYIEIYAECRVKALHQFPYFYEHEWVVGHTAKPPALYQKQRLGSLQQPFDCTYCFYDGLEK